MPPTEPDLVINAFEGGVIVRHTENAARAFCFDVLFDLENPHLYKLASAEKPPLHFHPYQEEYVQVTQGRLGLEVEGKEYILTPQDGEFRIRPWANHRLYPLLPVPGLDKRKTTRFLLSGEETPNAFRLDTVFFQNWYEYQNAVVLGRQRMDLIRVMNMFDAGGSYLSLPSWLPCGTRLAQLIGVVVGRWVGGLLGYQPFYREWTSDWQTACTKMRTSIFLRRFADQGKVNPDPVERLRT